MTVVPTISGKHPIVREKLERGYFTGKEQQIVEYLSLEWYVTRIGKLSLGEASSYKFALIKPTESYQQMFNLEREIVVIFSSYNSFEPRSFDAFDKISKLFQTLRLEKICYILFSHDREIEIKIQDLLKSNQESQVIIPLSYNEYLEYGKEPYYLQNKFKKFFYTRDLFAFENPLKSDLYFFGRNDLVHRIVNRHKANENSGLFGLRRTGKTSVIYGVKRVLDVEGEVSVIIDCQSPSFHMRRWNEALHYIITQIAIQQNLVIDDVLIEEYTMIDSALLFERQLIQISKKLNGKSIFIIFDEIENITFGVSPTAHWEKDYDFIFLWQTLRTVFQKHDNLLSYLIVGTNPLCVEQAKIGGKDNPIFNGIPFEYIDRFDVPQTREMVKRLGNFMGLKFEEIIYARLTEEYGGHPFLIRHVCSLINNLNKTERPTIINRLLYEEAKKEFDLRYHNYIEMILGVLEEYYIDEYNMLVLLALGELDEFKEYAISAPSLTNHLKGYGIIDETKQGYDFKIDSVKSFLVRKNKYKAVGLSLQEKHNEISNRRNQLEPQLRKLARSLLKAKYGEMDAKNRVLAVFGDPRKTKYSSTSYNDIFDANKSEIYLEDIRKIIGKEWTVFEFVFARDKEKFNTNMLAVNRYRADTHAKDISDDDFAIFRLSIKWLEEHVNNFLD